jgi:hypothetical protein
MHDLWKALAYLFPTAVPGKDYRIFDAQDGNGPFIAAWNLPDPQPTPDQITAAIASYDAQQAAAQQAEQEKAASQLQAAQAVIATAADPTQAAALTQFFKTMGLPL